MKLCATKVKRVWLGVEVFFFFCLQPTPNCDCFECTTILLLNWKRNKLFQKIIYFHVFLFSLAFCLFPSLSRSLALLCSSLKLRWLKLSTIPPRLHNNYAVDKNKQSERVSEYKIQDETVERVVVMLLSAIFVCNNFL